MFFICLTILCGKKEVTRPKLPEISPLVWLTLVTDFVSFGRAAYFGNRAQLYR